LAVSGSAQRGRRRDLTGQMGIEPVPHADLLLSGLHVHLSIVRSLDESTSRARALTKVGEADLAWIAGERAMSAADNADDPLAPASAARAAMHGLLAVGRYDDALDIGNAAYGWLVSHCRDDDRGFC
jgi:hypothetical protein